MAFSHGRPGRGCREIGVNAGVKALDEADRTRSCRERRSRAAAFKRLSNLAEEDAQNSPSELYVAMGEIPQPFR